MASNPPFPIEIFIFFFLIFPFAISTTSFENTTFILNSFNPNMRDIMYEGDAFPSDQLIQLTGNHPDSSGRATYIAPMHLWDSTSGSLANFSTHFSFTIDSQNKEAYGDGFTFFMAPQGSRLPPNSTGQNLGLVDGGGDSLKYSFFAVEFDSYRNTWDPPRDHVGIDLNSLVSVNFFPWWWSDVKNGLRVEAWITYNQISKNVSVRLIDANNTYSSSMYSIIDLKDYLPEYVTFGFSASTGAAFEMHKIHLWEFSSILELAPPSSPPPGQNPEIPRKGRWKIWLWFIAGAPLVCLVWYCLLKLREKIEVLTEPGNEVVVEPRNEDVVEPVNEVVVEPGNEVVVEPVNEVVIEPGNEVVVEPGNEDVVEPRNEDVVEPVNEVVLEPGNEVVVEPRNEDVVEPRNEDVVEPVNEVVVEPGNEVVIEPRNEDVVEPVNEVVIEPGNEVVVEPRNEDVVEPVNEVVIEPGNEVVESPRRFTYNELVSATNNFSQERFIGRGGFAMVYKGILSDKEVAVKRINMESRDLEDVMKEYAAEVKAICKLRHKNLVLIIGWCNEGDEFLIVYEFMQNNSLDFHLFQAPEVLTWEKRCEIAMGLAKALRYLQEESEPWVLHRDIKSSNVLLDSYFNPKLGDFGLARLVEHGQRTRTTTVIGTRGYMAQEYVESGRPSKESDVYSFGVVALEIASGKRAIKYVEENGRRVQKILVKEVWRQYGEENLVAATADEKLRGNYDAEQMKRLIVVGLSCAHPNHEERPSISEAIDMLNSKLSLRELPSEMPAYGYVAPPIIYEEALGDAASERG